MTILLYLVALVFPPAAIFACRKWVQGLLSLALFVWPVYFQTASEFGMGTFAIAFFVNIVWALGVVLSKRRTDRAKQLSDSIAHGVAEGLASHSEKHSPAE